MAILVHRARTSVAVGAAGAALLAGLLLGPRSAAPPDCELPPSPTLVAVGLEARAVSSRALAGSEQDIAVWIHAPAGQVVQRTQLALAIVLDRSGSMSGEAIANARAAATHLIDQLADSDQLTVITFSSQAETILPMTRADADGKRRAREAVSRIEADGGTCTSCGLEAAETELATVRMPLDHIVLISDGQANEGVADRDGLAHIAANIAAHGISISTVGVGLDFDEVTMTRLAEVGRGSYYFVEQTANLDAMFGHELGSVAQTTATQVRLTIAPAPGVRVAEVYGYPTESNDGALEVPIADLRSGETRKVVVRVAIPQSASGRTALVNLSLAWTRLVDIDVPVAERVAVATAITDDPEAVKSARDPSSSSAAAEARSANALEQATAIYESSHDAEAARAVIEQQRQAIHADPALPAETVRSLDQVQSETLEDFAAAPADGQAAAKPMKKAREQAYKLAR